MLLFLVSGTTYGETMPHDGVIRVEDLLRSPALQLRLVAGESGTSRRVAWAHVSELEDPTPWLFGSEMIMTTGIGIPGGAERQRAYLKRLDDAGVACLAISEGLFVPPLTKAFLAAADERGFAVVEVPMAVPFMAISQEVAAAVQVDTGQRLNAQLQVFGAVRWLAAGNLSTREIFARLERLSGYRLYACTTQRGPLLDGVPVPPQDQAKLIPSTPASPPTVPGGYVLPVSGRRGPAGYILAMETADAAPAGVSVVQHIATVAALQLSMQAHEREMLRREGAETLAEMLRGVLDEAVVTRRLAVHGFPPDAKLMLAIVRPKTRRPTATASWTRSPRAGSPSLSCGRRRNCTFWSPMTTAARAALAGARHGRRDKPAVPCPGIAGGGPAGGAVGHGPCGGIGPGHDQLRRRPHGEVADQRVSGSAGPGRRRAPRRHRLRRRSWRRPGADDPHLARA